MKAKRLLFALAFAGLLGAVAPAPQAQAQDSIYVPIFSYRTGPFSVGGLPIANGILTTEDEPQALARLDKGAEAVRVAVEMGKLRARLRGEGA